MAHAAMSLCWRARVMSPPRERRTKGAIGYRTKIIGRGPPEWGQVDPTLAHGGTGTRQPVGWQQSDIQITKVVDAASTKLT
jgi:hypothetical protein